MRHCVSFASLAAPCLFRTLTAKGEQTSTHIFKLQAYFLRGASAAAFEGTSTMHMDSNKRVLQQSGVLPAPTSHCRQLVSKWAAHAQLGNLVFDRNISWRCIRSFFTVSSWLCTRRVQPHRVCGDVSPQLACHVPLPLAHTTTKHSHRSLCFTLTLYYSFCRGVKLWTLHSSGHAALQTSR